MGGTAVLFIFRRGGQWPPMYPHIRRVRQLTATHTVYSTLGAAQGELPEGQERVPWGITVPHESLARYYRQHLRIQFADIDLHFTVGTVRNNVQKVCATLLSPRGPSLALRAIHLVSRLLEVAGLCSSTLSVNCEYFTK